MYSEPAKFVAKLRDMKTDHNVLLFKCELSAGHFSKSGRYVLFSYILKASSFPLPNLEVGFLPSSLLHGVMCTAHSDSFLKCSSKCAWV